MPKRVPAEVRRDPHFVGGGTYEVAQHGMPPIRSLAFNILAGEDPVVRLCVERLQAPRLKSVCQTRVERNGFLRGFCLARPNYLFDDGTQNAYLVCVEVDIFHLIAKNSLILNP